MRHPTYAKFYNYVFEIAQINGWSINPTEVETVVAGLIAQHAKHKRPYCPCEFITAPDASKICPCDDADGDIKRTGSCKCNLFISPDKLTIKE